MSFIDIAMSVGGSRPSPSVSGPIVGGIQIEKVHATLTIDMNTHRRGCDIRGHVEIGNPKILDVHRLSKGATV